MSEKNLRKHNTSQSYEKVIFGVSDSFHEVTVGSIHICNVKKCLEIHMSSQPKLGTRKIYQ